jgi:uncharacterized alpha/beta hydrolase family protein
MLYSEQRKNQLRGVGTMKKKGRSVIMLVVFSITAIIFGWAQPAASQQSKPLQTQIPTFFLHGYASSYRAERFLVKNAQQAGVTKTVVLANVLPDGRVLLQNSVAWQKDSHNPIVEVNFADNRDRNYIQDAHWFANVLRRLQQQHHFHEYNVVAHSMGNLALMYYLLGKNRLPGLRLKHQVDIAGPFDGSNIDGYTFLNNRLQKNGRPLDKSPFYHFFLAHRQRYPLDQTKVMNIYGDLDNGTASDGRVSTISAQSLKYLLQQRAKSYRQIEISGATGQHSRLHHNLRVSRLIDHFLWRAF